MSRFANVVLSLSATFAFATPQIAAAQASPINVAQFAGKPLYGPKGEKIGAVYKVNASGVPQLILEGRVVSVPAASLSVTDGKLSTRLSKKELVKRVR